MHAPHSPSDLPGAPAAVDLRSDTVTRPTREMYDVMQNAPIGDDGLDFDPSVRELEETVATRLGKDAGLFVPSCTMANLLAVLAQVGRNEQVVLESNAHMYTSERGAATFTGAFFLGVAGTSGAMDLGALDDATLGGKHKLRTALIAMETSHNNAGGAVLPLAHMLAVRSHAQSRGIPVHLDGARLFNAAVALDVPVADVAAHADTVSLCLSKGLSAPVGAVLSGPRDVMERARGLRRMIGGTQRQAGIMAAAGLYAVQHMSARLREDHIRAQRLSRMLNDLHPNLSATTPDSNIVQVDVSHTRMNSGQWSPALEAAGVLARPWGASRLRCVTHRHISDDDIERAVHAFKTVMQAGAG